MRAEAQQALEALQQNRPAGVERALAPLQARVFSFNMKACGDRQDAEDAMQETVLKAVSYLRRFGNLKAGGVALQGGQESLMKATCENNFCNESSNFAFLLMKTKPRGTLRP